MSLHNMNNLLFISLLFISTLVYSEEDFTEKFNSMISEACNSEHSRTIHLNHGRYYFKKPPKPINCALTIEGDGIGSTILIRSYQGNTFLYWIRGIDQSGGGIRNLTLVADSYTNKGIAIIVEATEDESNQDNSYNRHTFTIANIAIGRISGINTSWDHGIYLDGSKNPDGRQGFAPGIRMTQIMNTTISGTNVSQIYLNKARGPNLLNVDCFIPLNGSINGILIDNNTQGVKLDSRSCQYKFVDNESNWLVYNGVRFK